MSIYTPLQINVTDKSLQIGHCDGLNKFTLNDGVLIGEFGDLPLFYSAELAFHGITQSGENVGYYKPDVAQATQWKHCRLADVGWQSLHMEFGVPPDETVRFDFIYSLSDTPEQPNGDLILRHNRADSAGDWSHEGFMNSLRVRSDGNPNQSYARLVELFKLRRKELITLGFSEYPSITTPGEYVIRWNWNEYTRNKGKSYSDLVISEQRRIDWHVNLIQNRNSETRSRLRRQHNRLDNIIQDIHKKAMPFAPFRHALSDCPYDKGKCEGCDKLATTLQNSQELAQQRKLVTETLGNYRAQFTRDLRDLQKQLHSSEECLDTFALNHSTENAGRNDLNPPDIDSIKQLSDLTEFSPANKLPY